MRVLHVVMAKHGLMVQSGPFQGLVYTQSVLEMTMQGAHLGSTLIPKLLGCYEAELHAVLACVLATPYREIVDIGSGEGYYAVGLARRLPAVSVIAFESDTLRRNLCTEMARANGVAGRVIIAGTCEVDQLAARTSTHPLIVCDCEGCESDLLNPDLIPGLKECNMLVELHDFINPTISQTILSRFAATHSVTRIPTVERDPAAYPILVSLSAQDQRLALSEERPGPMEWVFLKVRKEQPQSGPHSPGGHSTRSFKSKQAM